LVKTVGIIGCGLMGHRRAESIKKIKTLKLISVCDELPSKARELSNKYNCFFTSNWRELVQSPGIDLIMICTPHNSLSKITIEALKNNKHVLVEKPAGINSKEIQKVIKVYEKQDKKIKVGFNHRFHPSIIKASEIIKSGILGKTMFIRAFYGNGARLNFNKEWRTREDISGGGELIDQGSHLIDLARLFLGDVKPIFGACRTCFWNIPVEDNVFFSLESKTHQIAHFHASWTEWKNAFRMDIMCQKGQITIEGLGKSYGVETMAVHKMKPEMGPPKSRTKAFWSDNSFELELRNLLYSIKMNREPNGNIYDALENMKSIEEIYKCQK